MKSTTTQNNLCKKCLVVHQHRGRKMVSKVFTLSLLILITSTIASSLKETVHRSQECYENGSYFGNVIDISRQYSPEDCANHCVYFANCYYFTFDPTKQMCEALEESPKTEV